MAFTTEDSYNDAVSTTEVIQHEMIKDWLGMGTENYDGVTGGIIPEF
jgi:hypothetical protein